MALLWQVFCCWWGCKGCFLAAVAADSTSVSAAGVLNATCFTVAGRAAVAAACGVAVAAACGAAVAVTGEAALAANRAAVAAAGMGLLS